MWTGQVASEALAVISAAAAGASGTPSLVSRFCTCVRAILVAHQVDRPSVRWSAHPRFSPSPPTRAQWLPRSTSCWRSNAGWPDMNGALCLQPVFRHRGDRVRRHAQLCWLTLLLVRCGREHHRPHLTQHPARARPDAPGQPRRQGRATLRPHPRLARSYGRFEG
jgi:hypothetical protein